MYIAIDGESVGKRIQQLILEERLEELRNFSDSITDTLFRFVELLEKYNSIIHMNGGDNIFAECTRECAQIVARYVYEENEKKQLFYSLAIGENPQDTYIGLNYAKSSKLHYVEVVRNGKQITFQKLI